MDRRIVLVIAAGLLLVAGAVGVWLLRAKGRTAEAPAAIPASVEPEPSESGGGSHPRRTGGAPPPPGASPEPMAKDTGLAACRIGDGGTIHCAALCERYCSKLASCGVETTPSCANDCALLASSGVKVAAYACVADRPCSAISGCGF